MKLPSNIEYIIKSLEEHNHEAYTVGGCIRDLLLGLEPEDWDICTSALPSEVKEVFRDFLVIDTGIKHGTVTLVLNKKHYEITTFRIDGEYTDNRRPANVIFTRNINHDLSRRDFTINALAYNHKKGLIDLNSGIDDLKIGIIRCIGNPNDRFTEDSLRIMRALRFASVFDFEIESQTKESIIRNKVLLINISVERIIIELNKFLLGDKVKDLMLEFFPVFSEIIPELKDLQDFNQNNPFHEYDVLNHTLHSIEHAQKSVHIRLAMLFHDIGKPNCYTEVDEIGHFYGHPKISSEIAENVLKRLKYDNETIKTVCDLIKYHDINCESEKSIKRLLNKIGKVRFEQLLEVKRADTMAQSEYAKSLKLPILQEIKQLFDKILIKEQCFTLNDLAINGNDLIELGISEGVKIGEILNLLLEQVIDENVENNKETLISLLLKS